MPPDAAARTLSAKIIPLRAPFMPRSRDEREFLPAALEIIETPASPVGIGIGATIIATALFALTWACIGKVDIIATAEGRILPIGKTKTIQPLEAGVVTAIRVADGDHVRAGQVLVELDPTEASADQGRLGRDLNQARLDLATQRRLEAALATGKAPELHQPPVSATSSELAAARASMQARAAEQAAKIQSLTQQADEKADEAEEAAASIAKLQASLPLVAQQEEIRHKLMMMEFGNKLAWLEAEQRLSEAQHDIQVMTHHRQEALASEHALEQQRDATAAEYAKTLQEDLEKTRSQVNQLQTDLTKTDKKLTYEVLKAPIDGTVQQLGVHTIGGVVTPAEPLLMIVPDDPGLTIEANVENKDVGFVHPGQKAQIKVETFSFTRYGLIEGTVTSLSRDSVTPNDEPQRKSSDTSDDKHALQANYVAHISLARTFMRTENGTTPLGPGMQVTVEIKTGRRSVISYLLSPLVKHVEEAVHER